jgi:hypothetical protein
LTSVVLRKAAILSKSGKKKNELDLWFTHQGHDSLWFLLLGLLYFQISICKDVQTNKVLYSLDNKFNVVEISELTITELHEDGFNLYLELLLFLNSHLIVWVQECSGVRKHEISHICNTLRVMVTLEIIPRGPNLLESNLLKLTQSNPQFQYLLSSTIKKKT